MPRRQSSHCVHQHLGGFCPLIGQRFCAHLQAASKAERGSQRGHRTLSRAFHHCRSLLLGGRILAPTMLISLPPELAVSASITAQNKYMRSTDQPIFSPSVSSYSGHLFYARRPNIATAEAMPRPNPPPTPGSSSDIRGKEGAFAPPTFNLPPTAYQEQDHASRSSATPSANGSDSSYRPVSPTSPGQSRKRPASQHGTVVTKDDFALPPPPTRSRKIIQMKPKEDETTSQLSESTPASTTGGRSQATTQAGGKRKQNNSGTAAGRKIARKTAHSLIERRRRSKMNEEFGVLKDMIPACQGQEMHKLAILQVGLIYGSV